jgi:hypothetical protein
VRRESVFLYRFLKLGQAACAESPEARDFLRDVIPFMDWENQELLPGWEEAILPGGTPRPVDPLPLAEAYDEIVLSVALAVKAAAADLIVPPTSLLAGLDWDEVRVLAGPDSPMSPGVKRELLSLLEVDDGRWAEGAEERLAELASLHLPVRCSPRVTSYLRQISSCYVVGLYAPTIAMCRSALESALPDLFEKRGMTLPPVGTSGSSTFKQRLDAVSRFKYLTPEGYRAAELVRLRANTVLHHDPDVVVQARGTVAATLEVLTEIYA